MRIYRKVLATMLSTMMICNTFNVSASEKQITAEQNMNVVEETVQENESIVTASNNDSVKTELPTQTENSVTPKKSIFNLLDKVALMLFSKSDYTYPIETAATLQTLVSSTEITDGKIEKITINNAISLIYLSQTDPSLYQDATITLASPANTVSNLTQSNVVSISDQNYSFHGLGDEHYPFKGQLNASSNGDEQLNLDRALFCGLSTSASTNLTESNFTLNWQGSETGFVFVDFVEEDETINNTTWTFKFYNFESNEQTYFAFQGIIGDIEVGTDVSNPQPLKIKVDFTQYRPDGDVILKRNVQKIEGQSNAGLVCNTLGEKAKLDISEVTIPSNPYTVTATEGDAGGLVGLMESQSQLIINPLTLDSVTVEATSGNAGGLVGSMEEDATITLNNGNVSIENSTIKGSSSAGGLVGSANMPSIEWPSNSQIIVTNNIIQDATQCGGLFGQYTLGTSNDAITLNIAQTYTISDNTLNPSNSGNAGGLFGLYTGSALNNTLSIKGADASNLTVSSSLGKNASTFGGLIGLLDTNSYTNIQYVNVKAESSSYTVSKGYGGLVGATNESAVLTVDQVTLEGKFASVKDSGVSGGMVGQLGSAAVLRLVGGANLSNMTTQSGSNKYGQIVGSQDSSLVYAESGWAVKFNRPSKTGALSDIGNYGAIIRLDNFDNLITFNTTSHEVTVAKQEDCYKAGLFSLTDTFTISDKKEFAALAITLQTKGLYNAFDNYTYPDPDTIDSNITLAADINMSGTGIQSLTRDNGDQIYTGTIDGSSKILTLDIGAPFGEGITNVTDFGTAGTGQMYYHDYLGLLGKVGSEAKIQNLTLEGNSYFFVGSSTTTTTYMGGVAAYSSGNNIIFDKVIANETIHIDGDQEGYIGGALGYFTSNDEQTLQVTNCTGSATINYYGSKETINIGGLVGGINQNNSGTLTLNFTNNTLKGVINQSNNALSDARVGGLVSKITPLNENSAPTILLNLTNTKIEGQQINANSTNLSGGLLGYEWKNTEVTLTNVVVKGSKVEMGGNAHFGGLVYTASGHWIIDKGSSSDGYGISFDENSKSTFTGKSTISGVTDGLLVCKGYVSNGSALYLEVRDGAYNASGAKIDGSMGRFDELVGVTMNVSSNVPNYSNGQGIVSIATGSTNGKMENSSGDYASYTNQATYTTTVSNNPYARYYYNLNTIGNIVLSGGTLTTPEQVMAWSLYQYAATNLKSYFATPSADNKYTISNTIDLTGYSYYPIDNSTAQVGTSDATTIIFDNKSIESIESKKEDKRSTTATNITASTTTATQHFGMHSGLFRNQSGSLTVKKVTLKGNVGQWGSGSGALICGDFKGNSNTTNNNLNLTLDNITLDGLIINRYSEGNSALLIQSICKNDNSGRTNIAISHITTTSKYSDDQLAAGSLLGSIGNSTATQIKLTFTDIRLDGRKNSGDLISSYGTTKSIFKNATLLDSFQYASECSGTYNFNQAEDWGDNNLHIQHVTYGAEITNSLKNPNGQLQYFDNDYYVDPTTPNNDSTAYDFTTDYLPYVAQTLITNVDLPATYYEIDVNVKSVDMVIGCGTYGDPYQISDYNQLKTLSKYLAGDNTPGWTIAYNKDKSFCKIDRTTDSESDHVLYQLNTNGNWYKYTEEGGIVQDPVIANTVMINYLRNAYYEITANITMQSNFGGIGTDTNPFMGVIVGKKIDGKNAKLTYTDSISIAARNGTGQLIGVSYGSVVKDLDIEYQSTITITQDDEPSKTLNRYFGAVMGNIMGGDNIIDDVTVTYKSPIGFDGGYCYATTVGGYVGLVQSGGVIFRNMQKDANSTGSINTGLSQLNTDNFPDYYYANPFVGRVLDGFVINEGDVSLENTDKNYKIHTMSSSEDKLSVVGTLKDSTYTGIITVDNAEELFILSAIVNSGAGAHSGKTSVKTYGSNAYGIGKVRCSDYSTVGNATDSNDAQYKQAINDDTYVANVSNSIGDKQSYLVAHYTDSTTDSPTNSNIKLASTLTGSYTRFTLTLNADCDMSAYGNGFRGISGRYTGTPAASGERNTLYLHGFNGLQESNENNLQESNENNYTITVAMKENAYIQDAYRSKAVGLFTTLGTSKEIKTSTGNIVIENLILKGSIEYCFYAGNSISEDVSSATIGTNIINDNAGVGGFVGTVTGGLPLVFQNVKLNDFKARGTNNAGGLVGYSTIAITITNCTYDNIIIDARYNSGGFIGYGTAAVTINANTNLTLSNARITRNQNLAKPQGSGGIIGASLGTLLVNKSESANSKHTITLKNMKIKSEFMGAGNNTTAVGGVVGSVNESEIYYVDVVDSTLDSLKLASTAKDKKDNYYYDQETYKLMDPYKINGTSSGSGWNSNNSAGGVVGNAAGNTTLRYVNVYATENNHFNIYSGANGGALVARHSSGELTVSDCKVSDGNDTKIKYGELILYSVSRVGGVVGYDGATGDSGGISIENTIVGNPDATTQFVARVGTSDGQCGGLIGGSNKDLKTATVISNCVVQNTIILARLNAGGIVGQSFESYTISNTTVKDSKIVATDASKMAGGLIGEMNNTLSASNILWSNNLVGYYISDADGKVAVAVPGSNDTKYDKTTIGLKKDTSYNTYDKLSITSDYITSYTNIGTWVGNNTNISPINLLGVSRQSTDGIVPALDVGSGDQSNYCIVYADYSGTASQENANKEDNKSPYVTINPTVNAENSENIAENDVSIYKDDNPTLLTGDGVLLKDNTGIAPTIWANYNENSNKINTAYVGASAGANKNYTISHFNDPVFANTQAPENMDIPVLVIDSTTRLTVWETIRDTLDALTNGGYSKARASSATSVSHILERCVLTNEGETQKYKYDNTKSASISYAPNNESGYLFYVTSGRYDNYGENSFTLLTVTFNDSYSIKLPIMVKRVVDINFTAQSQNGTVFLESQFGNTDNILSDYGEKTTTLLTYTYNYNKTNLQLAGNYNWADDINSGGNYLWYYNKKLSLSDTLAQDSKLTLIDLNQEYKAQYETLDNGQNELDLLTLFNPWKPQYMCDLLELSAESNESGNMIKIGEVQGESLDFPSGATIRIKQDDGYQYYGLKPDNYEGTTYSITVGETKPTEKYYLIIESQEVDKVTKLSIGVAGTSMEIRDKGLPNSLTSTKSGITILTPLNQTLTYTNGTPSSLYNALSKDGATISFTLKDTITVDDGLIDFITSDENRYLQFALQSAIYEGTTVTPQSFSQVSLKTTFTLIAGNTEIDGGSTTINSSHPEGTNTIYLPYEINNEMVNLCTYLNNSNTGYKNITVVAEVEMTFSSDSMDIFPGYTATQIQDNQNVPPSYLQIIPSAKLATNVNNLNGGVSANLQGGVNHGFYRVNDNQVILDYDPIMSVSQLGINPNDVLDMAESKIINTEGRYDLSSLEDYSSIIDSTDHIVCELRLYRKDNTNNYIKVTGTKLDEFPITITSRTTQSSVSFNYSGSTANPSENDSWFTWSPGMSDLKTMTYKRFGQNQDISCYENGVFTLPFDIEINSNNINYANYKVELTVRLVTTNEEILHLKTNYYKYTYAKIATNMLTGN